jgi:hypothetical protein
MEIILFRVEHLSTIFVTSQKVGVTSQWAARAASRQGTSFFGSGQIASCLSLADGLKRPRLGTRERHQELESLKKDIP